MLKAFKKFMAVVVWLYTLAIIFDLLIAAPMVGKWGFAVGPMAAFVLMVFHVRTLNFLRRRVENIRNTKILWIMKAWTAMCCVATVGGFLYHGQIALFQMAPQQNVAGGFFHLVACMCCAVAFYLLMEHYSAIARWRYAVRLEHCRIFYI